MRTKTRALSVFAGTTAGLIFLAGCSAGPAEPETQAPTAEVQEDKVRLLSAEEVAERAKKDAESSGRAYTGPKTTGLQAILALGDCELSVNLSYSSQKVGTHSKDHAARDDPRDRSLVHFDLKRTWSQACSSNLSDYLSGMKIVGHDGEVISAYQQAYVHKPTSTESNVYEDKWGSTPTLGPKSSGNAALEVDTDKFGPDMKLVLETPDGEFIVEAQDWDKPSDDYADEYLIENGACLAGEKL